MVPTEKKLSMLQLYMIYNTHMICTPDFQQKILLMRTSISRSD